MLMSEVMSVEEIYDRFKSADRVPGAV